MKNLYLKALYKKFRFETPQGNLNMEQLFDLSQKQLHELYIQLESNIQQSKGLLGRRGNVEIEEKLDIVKDIFELKQDLANEAKDAAYKRELKQQVLEVAASKEIEELVDGKTSKDLRKLARKL